MTPRLRTSLGIRHGVRITLAASSIVALSLLAPAAAGADPVSDPCSLAIVVFCRLLPMAPGLDHDIDLTTQYPAPDPSAPAPDSLPPADICPRGCS